MTEPTPHAEPMNVLEPTTARTPSRRANRPEPTRPIRRWAGRLMTAVLLIAAAGAGYMLRDRFASPTTTAPAAEGPDVAASPTIWTCSMHPQIQQPNPGQCPICGMELIPLVSDGGEDRGLREVTITRAARELMDLQTAPVERRFVEATIRMVGKVTYDETRLGDITSRVPGRLDRLYVDYTGVDVKQGDHMVSIYSPELYSAQAELIRAVESTREQRSRGAAESARRLLESTREKLRLWGMTPDQIREIEGQTQPSDHMTLYAPMSGVVIHKNAQEGMYVETGSRIYTIADLDEVWVKLDAYESDLTWLRYGQAAEFTTEAYPGEVFTGRVAFIDPVLDPKTRTVKVRVNVPNPSGRLKPEMFVRGVVHAGVATGGRVMDPGLVGKWICRMHPGVIKDGPGACPICGMPLVQTETLGYVSTEDISDEAAEPLVVPASAVLRTGTRAVVYVELPDADVPTYEGREIVLGPRAGDFYLVRSGLEAGEWVVTEGNFRLDSALQIAAKPSMMNPDAGIAAGLDGLDVPPSVALQLGRVRDAAKVVDEFKGGDDPEAIRRALRDFEDAVATIDPSTLQGRAEAVWKELAMRLRNDAVEGRWAAGPERIDGAVERLLADVGRLGDQFGLPQRPMTAALDVPPGFRERLKPLWKTYQNASDALVHDDPAAARAAALAASKALAEIDSAALEGPARTLWTTAVGEMKTPLRKLGDATELSASRTAFASWTKVLEPVVGSIGMPSEVEKVYEHTCAMALANRGASWLQTGELVNNPYMGQKMPRCSTGVKIAWDSPPAESEVHDHE